MNSAPLYPLFLNLKDRHVLIVGGGSVALRKINSLLECEPAITVISPTFAPAFPQGLANVQKISAPYVSTIITQKPWRLIFVATHSPETNAQVQRDANAANIPCCRCDDPLEGDFASAAVTRLGQITIAVSTHGASPSLALKIRDQAAAAIDPHTVTLAKLSAEWRQQIKQEIKHQNARATLFQKLASPEMEATLHTHGLPAAEKLFHQWLAETKSVPPAPVDRG